MNFLNKFWRMNLEITTVGLSKKCTSFRSPKLMNFMSNRHLLWRLALRQKSRDFKFGSTNAFWMNFLARVWKNSCWKSKKLSWKKIRKITTPGAIGFGWLALGIFTRKRSNSLREWSQGTPSIIVPGITSFLLWSFWPWKPKGRKERSLWVDLSPSPWQRSRSSKETELYGIFWEDYFLQ